MYMSSGASVTCCRYRAAWRENVPYGLRLCCVPSARGRAAIFARRQRAGIAVPIALERLTRALLARTRLAEAQTRARSCGMGNASFDIICLEHVLRRAPSGAEHAALHMGAGGGRAI